MAAIADVYFFWAAGVVAFCLFLFVVNFLSNGWFFTFMRVKASRGKLKMVRIVGIDTAYFRSGSIDGEMLIFKNRAKTRKRVRVIREAIYRSMGCDTIDVDDQRDAVFLPSGEGVQGFDAAKTDSLITRALMAPKIEDNKMKILLLCVVVVGIIAIAAAYFAYQGHAVALQVQQQVSALATTGVVQ